MWNNLPNTVIALTSAVTLGLVVRSEERPALARFDEVLLVESLTPDEQALVDWATDRFARAGLDLPELTVHFDPTRERCDNADGQYHHGPDGERVVTVCTPDFDTFASQLGHRRTLLHEFGHAWDFANLSAEDHDGLARILGADGWNDHGDAWADRGVERFAEAFVLALLDQRRRQLKVGVGCPELLDAFTTATGAGPLGPGLPPCAAVDRVAARVNSGDLLRAA